MKKVLDVVCLLASVYWVIAGSVFFIRDIVSGNKIADVEWISRLALGIAMFCLCSTNNEKQR